MDHSDVSSNELPIYEMIDHVSDGIYITCNGKFVFVNKKMMEMFELSKEEIIGMPSWNLAIPEKREEIRKTMIRLVGERNTTPVEIECLTKSGHKIIVEIRYSGLVDADKVFGIVIDITKRKQIEKELINAKHKAEENDRLKSAFLANMSHEIRTPMNAIIGFSALLSKRTVDEEKKNIYIKYITESCQQLLVLVNDILDVSKIETKQLSICLSKVNVNNLLNEIYSVFSEQVNLEKLDFTIKAQLPDNLSYIQTDRIRLKQILFNLIGNALKYTKEGSIEYGYTVNADTLQFYVKDSGIGIEPEQISRIFDRFYQVEITQDTTRSGVGLGLAICKGLMELLGGTIWCESAPRCGSTFYFTIPYSISETK